MLRRRLRISATKDLSAGRWGSVAPRELRGLRYTLREVLASYGDEA